MNTKAVVISVLVVLLAGIGFWLGYLHSHATPIVDLLGNPRQYEGKTVTIEGRVVESQSLFVVKYFVLEDKTGRINVVTDRVLPQVGKLERVRGQLKEAFAIGPARMLVLLEESKAP